jgi:membrane protein implicated in regulation of membrane protease activity
MWVFFAVLAMILAIAIAPTVAKDKNTKIKVDNQAIDKGMQEQGQKADISRRVMIEADKDADWTKSSARNLKRK